MKSVFLANKSTLVLQHCTELTPTPRATASTMSLLLFFNRNNIVVAELQNIFTRVTIIIFIKLKQFLNLNLNEKKPFSKYFFFFF